MPNPAQDCPHTLRIEAVFEDYRPIGVVRVVQCTACRQVVGTEYYEGNKKWVEGLGVNHELPTSTRAYLPSFNLIKP